MKNLLIRDKKQVFAWLLLLVILVLAYNGWKNSNKNKPVASRANQQISQPEKKATGQQANIPKSVEIMAPMLNFRIRPELKDEAVVTVLKKGTVVELLEEQGAWLKVKLADGRVGFISAQPNLVQVKEK